MQTGHALAYQHGQARCLHEADRKDSFADHYRTYRSPVEVNSLHLTVNLLHKNRMNT